MSMNPEFVRTTLIPGFLALDCQAPGCRFATEVPAERINSGTLSDIEALGEHRCEGASFERATRREIPRAADKAMIKFIAEQLVPDDQGVVLLAELVERFEVTTGIYPDLSIFARKLREHLPASAEVRREMVDGVRANRLLGMRLR